MMSEKCVAFEQQGTINTKRVTVIRMAVILSLVNLRFYQRRQYSLYNTFPEEKDQGFLMAAKQNHCFRFTIKKSALIP